MGLEIKPTLDILTRWITFGFCALILLLLGRYLRQWWTLPSAQRFDAVLIGKVVALAAILAVPYLLSPKRYQLTDDALTIGRPLSSVVIPRDRIVGARRLTATDTRGLVRTFGVGGLFGYFGRYWSKTLGSMSFYATNRKTLLLIELRDSRSLVLSPPEDDLVELLNQLKGS